jgi:hypothetical protein
MDHQDNTDISSNPTTKAGEAAHRLKDIMAARHRDQCTIQRTDITNSTTALVRQEQVGCLPGSWG